ncbi:MAG: histidinol-phosphate transaminase [Flavobacteriaceae bacterium]|nr:histidinol-phosphate transaminase [Bacteroidia bacterium]NNK86669.1 histidinol-phosphate transaminase [Flavobacteriaceae bacterium]
MTRRSIKELVRTSVRDLKPYSSARDEFQGDSNGMVFLDANENPFGSGLNRYPDPRQIKLKQVLASIKHVAVENVLCGNGSDEILDLIVRAFCEPKRDKLVILPPTYGMYKVIAGINDIAVVSVNLNPEFQPEVEEILKKSDANTKMLFLCSPNNPSSNAFQRSRIEQLIMNFDGIVVIDEAYADFSSERSFVNDIHRFPNLIVTQTLSKAFGLAGIRLGLCFASAFIIETLHKIKPPYNVNALTQQQAITALLDREKLNSEINLILQQRERLANALKNIKIVEHVFPSDSNFLLVKVDDARSRYEQLIELGIVVRDRSNLFGCENCLRFTIGTTDENKALIKALNELK